MGESERQFIVLAAGFLSLLLTYLIVSLDFALGLWVLVVSALSAPIVLPGMYVAKMSQSLRPATSPKLWAVLDDHFDSVRVLSNSGVEAYTTRVPHRTLLVSQGAIDELDPTELRALVAHERAHQDLNHITRLVLIRLIWLSVWSLAMVTYFSSWSPAAICVAAVVIIGDVTISRAWLRLSEFQADRYAAEATSKEDYYSTLSKIESSHWDLSLRARVFSSHPSTRDRVRYLEQR